MRLRIPEDDETLPRLKQTRRDLQRVLLEADEQEATANTRAAASQAAPSVANPPPQQASPEAPREAGSRLRYTLAMKQLDCEIARLRSPRLIDVEQGTVVQPDTLKDLLKVDVPDIRKSVDRARDVLKTLTLVAEATDEQKILEAQDVCERAINWIVLVEGRCKAAQLHLDVEQPPMAEVSRECGPGESMKRIEWLEDALSTAVESRAAEMEAIQRNIVARRMEVGRQFAKLRKQLWDQKDRVSELESSNARLKASCATADAASQTHPTPSQEYEVPTAALDVKKDANCNNPEAEDATNKGQTSVLLYIEPKRKRKPRKNRSGGARSRAKAAAALALLEAETVASTLSTSDPPVLVTEAAATLILTESKVSALVLPTRDLSVPGLEETPVPVTDVDQASAVDPGPAASADDGRCIAPPSVEHSFGHMPQSPGVNVRNILHRFRLFLWVQITKLDPRTWRI
jgi:hypothetical protein